MKNTQKLPKRFKQKWVKALRSGKYTQGTGCLFQNWTEESQYCCLGVACIILGIKEEYLEHKSIIDKNVPMNDKVPMLLHGCGNFRYDNYNPIVEKLTDFNDNGKSFNWIAYYVNRYL